jgi:hypothetical protein
LIFESPENLGETNILNIWKEANIPLSDVMKVYAFLSIIPSLYARLSDFVELHGKREVFPPIDFTIMEVKNTNNQCRIGTFFSPLLATTNLVEL